MCKGTCNRQHSEIPNLYCSEKKGHDGLCHCSPKIEEKIILQCKDLIRSLNNYNKDYDAYNESDNEVSYIHEYADSVKSTLEDFSFCLNEREKVSK
jgi:hypothetical protein